MTRLAVSGAPEDRRRTYVLSPILIFANGTFANWRIAGMKFANKWNIIYYHVRQFGELLVLNSPINNILPIMMFANWRKVRLAKCWIGDKILPRRRRTTRRSPLCWACGCEYVSECLNAFSVVEWWRVKIELGVDEQVCIGRWITFQHRGGRSPSPKPSRKLLITHNYAWSRFVIHVLRYIQASIK
jgi:hypothetical protein